MVKKMLIFDNKQDREDVINSLRNTPNKIIHDSGGRMMIIETREPDEEILRKVPRKVRLSSDHGPMGPLKIKNVQKMDPMLNRMLLLRLYCLYFL